MILNTATVLPALVSLCQSPAIVGWGVEVGVAVENLPLWLRKRKDSRGENHPFQGFHEVPEAVRSDSARTRSQTTGMLVLSPTDGRGPEPISAFRVRDPTLSLLSCEGRARTVVPMELASVFYVVGRRVWRSGTGCLFIVQILALPSDQNQKL